MIKQRCVKLIAWLLAISLLIPTVSDNGNVIYAEEIVYGDTDSSLIVDAKDALSVLKHAAKIEILGEESIKSGDVDASGIIDAEDALLILKKAAKLIEKFPVEENLPETTPELTSTPKVTTTPKATATPAPTEEPTATPTATPTIRPTAPVPEVSEEDEVEGISVEIKELNGAIYYEDKDIISFTNESSAAEKGVQIVNPIAGNKEMVEDYGYLFDSEAGENEINYPRPENKQGYSMSFWAKTEKETDDSAVLVFADETQTMTVSINGTVKYRDGLYSDNSFSGTQETDEPDYSTGEWHYYTITFANDWICFYVDGVEVPYDDIELNVNRMGSFNNGFLTRKNAVVSWTEEDYANDWQGYIQKQRVSSEEYDTITNPNYTVFGNGRYDEYEEVERLLLTFMSGEATEVYIGGTDVEVDPRYAEHGFRSGTKVAKIQYYLQELTAENARANYLKETIPDDSGITDELPDELVGIAVEVKDIHKSAVYDEENAIYSFTEAVKEEGEYYGVEMRNPFELNTNVTQTIEEALEGQTLFPVSCTPDPENPDAPVKEVLAGNSYALQAWRGNYYSDYYYGDITKYGNFMKPEEISPETATVMNAFHKPVWTAGASVGFWFKPTRSLAKTDSPILTMGKDNEFFFTLSVDGTVMYFDGHGVSFKGGQIPFKENMPCYNSFTAIGDSSMVTPGKWNYYMVTFANDWIQVYINGEEVIYKSAGLVRQYTKQFNAGFLTRYNNVGLVTEDPDPLRQYITKSWGLSDSNLIKNDDYYGNDETCIRANGVYEKGYLKAGEDNGYGKQNVLMLDNFTVEGASFYMGGFPSCIMKDNGWSSNEHGRLFYTDHSVSSGSKFTDVLFFETELDACDAKTIYERELVDAPTN